MASSISSDIASLSFIKQTNSNGKKNCYIVGRAIGQYSAIGFGSVCGVSFLAAIVFGAIAASSMYMPFVSFIAGMVAIGCAVASLACLVAMVASCIIYGVFDTKMKTS